MLQRLQSQKSQQERALHKSVENKDLHSAIEHEASYKLLEWVIELPHTLMKEFANSGDNT
jgi:ribosomal protein L9